MACSPGGSLYTVPRRILFSETAGFTDGRVADMTAFIIKVQADHLRRRCAGSSRIPSVSDIVAGTNWNFGVPDLAAGEGNEYSDNHVYWDHPNFPGEPWSSTDWTMANQPMARVTHGATIGGLFAGDATAGKPSTVSEYNHPFPNRYGSEGMLFLAAYAAFHDIDGFMFFDYNGGTRWTDDRIESYFDMHRNTAQMILMPSLARAFRDGLISPAKQTLLLQFTEKDVCLIPCFYLWGLAGSQPGSGSSGIDARRAHCIIPAPVSNRNASPRQANHPTFRIPVAIRNG